MDPAVARQILSMMTELRALGVEHLDVFGSVARNSAGSDSDVDVLVHVQGKATLRQLVAIRDLLTTALGRRVDITTPGALRDRPRLRRNVLEDCVRVA